MKPHILHLYNDTELSDLLIVSKLEVKRKKKNESTNESLFVLPERPCREKEEVTERTRDSEQEGREQEYIYGSPVQSLILIPPIPSYTYH